jgi:hypothetical protein
MNLEAAPHAKLDITNILNMSVKWSNLAFNSVTKKFAQLKEINYGFAVKYNIIENNIDKTLFKTANYKLIDLIKS